MIFDFAQPSALNFPPYVFRKRNERVDWRKIAAVDPDRIAREVDFKTLQENINNVTFCDVESELSGPDERPLDPNYVKLFKLAQLTIEYLLNCQQYLTGIVGERETQLEKLLKESSNVTVELDKGAIPLASRQILPCRNQGLHLPLPLPVLKPCDSSLYIIIQ